MLFEKMLETTDRSALPAAEQQRFDYLDDAKLADAAKWAAGGFTLLAGLLTFFGIKEGVLDRLLRAKPERAMLVFALVGIGVLCSLLGPAFRPGTRVKVWGVLTAVFLIGLTLTLAAVRDSTATAKVLSAAALALVVAAAVMLRKAEMSVLAAVIVLGVAATSMGLHSAASIAVESKAGGDLPRVAAALGRADGAEAVTVSFAADRVEDQAFLVLVRGDGTELYRALLVPDRVGSIEETLSVPVVADRWAAVTVGYCALDDGGSCDGREVPAVTLRPERGEPRVAARVTAGTKAGTAEVSVDVVNVPVDESVRVEVAVRRGGTERVRHTARLVTGAAAWTPAVGGLRAGDVVTVRYTTCAPECTGDAADVAVYTAR